MKGQTAAIYAISVLVIVCGIALAPVEHPTRWFEEKQTVTAYSALLLYTCALVSALNFLAARTLSHLRKHARSMTLLWALAIPGFVFLMADEFFVMHEGMSRFLVYRVLGLAQSPYHDRLDAFVIAAYGLCGVAVLFYYRQDLKQIHRFFRFLTAGACFAVISLASDLRQESVWNTYLEEGAKVLANTSFLLACISSALQNYQAVRAQLDREAAPQAKAKVA